MTEKLDMTTPDGVTQNIERIAALFPNCVTETAEGKAIDFDLLRQELSADIVEGPKERYRLEWPGKREAIVTANMPTTNTLRPVREDSINFDTTENLYIEGDNLEVLKLLQESYLGKVKMIYIDPPYNTGNDFVYKDNFAQNTDEFKTDSGMTDELGNRLVANPETAGRYHSDWLTMMYPRLKLARNLLTDDGVIFISIDDNEVHNLRKMCDEVFGEVNFVADFIWKRRASSALSDNNVSTDHEYVLCYMKGLLEKFSGLEKDFKNYSNPDNDPRGSWVLGDLTVGMTASMRPNQAYDLVDPVSGISYPFNPNRVWSFIPSSMNKMLEEKRVVFPKDQSKRPMQKRFLNELKSNFNPISSLLFDKVGLNTESTKLMQTLLDGNIFDYSKPLSLLTTLIPQVCNCDDIILDFFSGSATTAHAVMQLNAEDGGNRKFIMVQLPEKTDEKSEAYKAGYHNICEIGKERIRRAGAKIVETQGLASKKEQEKGASLFDTEHETQNKITDIGFRVYRLDTSNMQDVYYRPQDYKQEMMDELFANHIKPERTADDLVAQVMLDWGLPLSLPIEKTEIAGKTVYKVDGNALYCCFDDNIDEAFARAAAAFAPLRIVFHDHSFVSDTAKENVRQLLKQLSPETEMKVI